MATRQNLVRFLLVLVLIMVLGGAAVAVWQLGRQPGATPTPAESPLQASPLLTPTVVSTEASPPALWSSRGVAFLWVVLGALLALVMAFFILRRYRQDI